MLLLMSLCLKVRQQVTSPHIQETLPEQHTKYLLKYCNFASEESDQTPAKYTL